MVFVGDGQQFWGICRSQSCVTTHLGSGCGVFVFIKRSVRKSEVPMTIHASARPCVVNAQRDLSVLTALFTVCMLSTHTHTKAHCWLDSFLSLKKKKKREINMTVCRTLYTFPVFSNQKWQLSGFPPLSLWVVRVCVTLCVVVRACVRVYACMHVR